MFGGRTGRVSLQWPTSGSRAERGRLPDEFGSLQFDLQPTNSNLHERNIERLLHVRVLCSCGRFELSIQRPADRSRSKRDRLLDEFGRLRRHLQPAIESLHERNTERLLRLCDLFASGSGVLFTWRNDDRARPKRRRVFAKLGACGSSLRKPDSRLYERFFER